MSQIRPFYSFRFSRLFRKQSKKKFFLHRMWRAILGDYFWCPGKQRFHLRLTLCTKRKSLNVRKEKAGFWKSFSKKTYRKELLLWVNQQCIRFMSPPFHLQNKKRQKWLSKKNWLSKNLPNPQKKSWFLKIGAQTSQKTFLSARKTDVFFGDYFWRQGEKCFYPGWPSLKGYKFRLKERLDFERVLAKKPTENNCYCK